MLQACKANYDTVACIVGFMTFIVALDTMRMINSITR